MTAKKKNLDIERNRLSIFINKQSQSRSRSFLEKIFSSKHDSNSNMKVEFSSQFERVIELITSEFLSLKNQDFVISIDESSKAQNKSFVEDVKISSFKKSYQIFEMNDSLTIIIETISSSNNRNFNYNKTLYTRKCVMLLLMLKILSSSNSISYWSSFFWNQISFQNVEATIAIYRLLSNAKKKSINAKTIQILDAKNCSYFYNLKVFHSFLKRVREDLNNTSDDLIEIVSVRERTVSILSKLQSIEIKTLESSSIMSSSSRSKSSISLFSSLSRFEESFSFRSSQSYREISASIFESMKNREISNFDEFYDKLSAWFLQNARIKKQDDVEQITNWVSRSNHHQEQERVKSSSSQWFDYDRFLARSFNNISSSSVRRLNRNERTVRYYFNVDERRYQFRDESISSSSFTHDRQRTQIKDHDVEIEYWRNLTLKYQQEIRSQHQIRERYVSKSNEISRSNYRSAIAISKRHDRSIASKHYDRSIVSKYYDRSSLKDDRFDNFVSREFRRLKSLFNRFQLNVLNHYDHHDRFEESSTSIREQRERSLRSQNVMIWNSTKQTINFFIRRFYHIVELENIKVVLRILFMCFKSDILDEHNDLSIKIRFEMNFDLIIWKDELFREFRLNRFEFIKKTKKMTFRFNDKNLTFNQYFTRKINLLHETKIIDENIIVRYLWEDLESQLILVISMRKNDNIIENFDRRVRNNERVARKVYELIKKINVFINRDLRSQNRFTSQNYNVLRQTSFISFVARIERLINNYQKTTN